MEINHFYCHSVNSVVTSTVLVLPLTQISGMYKLRKTDPDLIQDVNKAEVTVTIINTLL